MFSLWTRYEMAFDGFFSLARTLGEGCRQFIPRLRFFFFFSSLEWRSARAYQFHFLGLDQSTVAQQNETTLA